MECSIRIRQLALQVVSLRGFSPVSEALGVTKGTLCSFLSQRHIALVVSPECAFWDQQGEECYGNLGQEKPTRKEHCTGKAL